MSYVAKFGYFSGAYRLNPGMLWNAALVEPVNHVLWVQLLRSCVCCSCYRVYLEFPRGRLKAFISPLYSPLLSLRKRALFFLKVTGESDY